MKIQEFMDEMNNIKENIWNAENFYVTVMLDGTKKYSNVDSITFDNEKIHIRVVEGEFIKEPTK